MLTALLAAHAQCQKVKPEEVGREEEGLQAQSRAQVTRL
jgi:hypothetical protein